MITDMSPELVRGAVRNAAASGARLASPDDTASRAASEFAPPIPIPRPAPPSGPVPWATAPYAAPSVPLDAPPEAVLPEPAPYPAFMPAPSTPARTGVPEVDWLLVLDGAPGTDPSAVAAALPHASAAHPGGLTVLPGCIGGAGANWAGPGGTGLGGAGLYAVGLDQSTLTGYSGQTESDERSRCLTQTAVLRALPGRHLVVRDWVSALAAAAAVAGLDGGRLLRARAQWAQTCLDAGLLRLADGYAILDLEPRQSMARVASTALNDPRRDILVAEQFRAFWLSPAASVRGFPSLAAALRRLRIERVDGRLAPSTLAQAVRDALG